MKSLARKIARLLGKSVCHASVKTRVQIPRTHIKASSPADVVKVTGTSVISSLLQSTWEVKTDISPQKLARQASLAHAHQND